MSALSPQAERALCAYLTQSLLNEEADRYADLMAVAHLSSRPAHINPHQNPYLPLNLTAAPATQEPVPTRCGLTTTIAI